MHELVHDAVMSRRMPPWQPDACCNHYRFDRSLSDAECETLVGWIDRTRYIIGFDFQPGVRAMVHHVIVFAIDEAKIGELERRDGSDGRPGWDCFGEGSELQGDKRYVGGWQPGVLARVLPDGIGRELPAHRRHIGIAVLWTR